MRPCCAPRRDEHSERRLPAVAPVGGRADLVAVAGGTFAMGSDGADAVPGDGEGPVRTESVEPFGLGACAVTNAEFAAFVAATGYATDAERHGWSFVFHREVTPGAEIVGSSAAAPWWVGVAGAYWRAPAGADSGLDGRSDHAVVHVSWHDAAAYAAWCGCRLPAEREWELAARGGLEGNRYPWGDELLAEGVWRCNIWQGVFPLEDTGEDGYTGVAPVRAYEPNALGFYNMVGNVWEWCLDEVADARVVRGGSYLCHDSYCNRYRTSARTWNTPSSSTGHTGFRVARSAEVR